MRYLLIAMLGLTACKKTKVEEVVVPPPAPAAAPQAVPAERIKRLSPAEIKASDEGAEKKEGERIDKRFDEAQKQGQ